MVHTTDIASAVSYLSGALGVLLLLFALRAFRRSDDGRLLFVAGAFGIFAAKGLFVAWALGRGSPGHETLELIDALGDMATVLLLVLPLLPSRSA